MRIQGPQPSTSSGKCKEEKNKYHSDIVKNFTSDGEDDNQLCERNHRLHVGEILLSNMVMNIDNEEKYIHFLKQLSKFEADLKHEGICCKEFTIVQTTDLSSSKLGKIKSSVRTESGREQSETSSKSKNILQTTFKQKVECQGCFSDRVETRRTMLKHFQEYCKDDESYECLLNNLFDLEEMLSSDQIWCKDCESEYLC